MSRHPISHLWQSDFLIDVAKGVVSGHSLVHKFGRNTAVGTSFVPVCLGGVYQTPQAASATTLRVKAGDAIDTAAGNGAREVTLIGLDENFNEITVAVATAGASASSATTETFTRLHRAYVSASGTYATSSAGSHQADIVIENGAGGTDWATIDATDFPKSQTEIAVYSIPTGYTGHFLYASAFSDSTKTTNLLLFKREALGDTAAPYEAMRVLLNLAVGGGDSDISPRSPMTIAGPADVGWMAKVDSTTAEVDIDFEILLVKD